MGILEIFILASIFVHLLTLSFMMRSNFDSHLLRKYMVHLNDLAKIH